MARTILYLYLLLESPMLLAGQMCSSSLREMLTGNLSQKQLTFREIKEAESELVNSNFMSQKTLDRLLNSLEEKNIQVFTHKDPEVMKIYQALDDEILSDEELIEGANGFFEYFTKEEIETISYQGRAVIVLREGNDEIAQTLFHESIHSKFLKFKNTFSRSKIIDSNFLNPERYYGQQMQVTKTLVL